MEAPPVVPLKGGKEWEGGSLQSAGAEKEKPSEGPGQRSDGRSSDRSVVWESSQYNPFGGASAPPGLRQGEIWTSPRRRLII